MKKIYVYVQLFDSLQKIEILENNESIDLIQLTMAEIPEKLCQLSKQYNITEINIIGPPYYVNDIERKTKQKEMDKYQSNILTFKYI